MNQRPSPAAGVALAVIGVALCGFSLYGFSSHEITLGRPNRRASESLPPRPQTVTLAGWPADVARLGFATVGLLLIVQAVCPDRRTAIRNNLIAVAAWLGVSAVYLLWRAATP